MGTLLVGIPAALLVTGIGGTGVLTVGAILTLPVGPYARRGAPCIVDQNVHLTGNLNKLRASFLGCHIAGHGLYRYAIGVADMLCCRLKRLDAPRVDHQITTCFGQCFGATAPQTLG